MVGPLLVLLINVNIYRMDNYEMMNPSGFGDSLTLPLALLKWFIYPLKYYIARQILGVVLISMLTHYAMVVNMVNTPDEHPKAF